MSDDTEFIFSLTAKIVRLEAEVAALIAENAALKSVGPVGALPGKAEQ